MNYSYQLRGTNGSGKTFVANYLMLSADAKPLLKNERGKIRAYSGNFHGIPMVFLGSYESKCGGCDTIQPFEEIPHLIRLFMTDGTPGVLFFEGLLISHMLGQVAKAQKELGVERNILSFLDTPLEKCIERVMTRRMLRKDERPFDPKNVIKDHPRVSQSMVNAIDQGYRVRVIDHKNACTKVREDLEKLYQGEL